MVEEGARTNSMAGSPPRRNTDDGGDDATSSDGRAVPGPDAPLHVGDDGEEHRRSVPGRGISLELRDLLGVGGVEHGARGLRVHSWRHGAPGHAWRAAGLLRRRRWTRPWSRP